MKCSLKNGSELDIREVAEVTRVLRSMQSTYQSTKSKIEEIEAHHTLPHERITILEQLQDRVHKLEILFSELNDHPLISLDDLDVFLSDESIELLKRHHLFDKENDCIKPYVIQVVDAIRFETPLSLTKSVSPYEYESVNIEGINKAELILELLRRTHPSTDTDFFQQHDNPEWAEKTLAEHHIVNDGWYIDSLLGVSFKLKFDADGWLHADEFNKHRVGLAQEVIADLLDKHSHAPTVSAAF